MNSALYPARVRSNDVLGVIFIVLVRLALAVESLSATTSAALNIAPFDMQLPLYGAAVVARLSIGSPVIFLCAVSHTWYLPFSDYARENALGGRDLLRPPLNHLDAAIHDFSLLSHVLAPCLTPNG